MNANISARPGIDLGYKRNVTIIHHPLSANGVAGANGAGAFGSAQPRKTLLIGAFCHKATIPGGDMNSDDMQEIPFTIAYDDVIIVPAVP